MANYWDRKRWMKEQGPVDYSQGTYYGGAGLPGTSFEGQAAQGGQMAQGAGSALMTAGAIPSPASPFLMGAGLALQAGGTAWNAIEGAKDKKRANALEDEKWAVDRRRLLQELAERKKASDWKAGFARAMRNKGGS